MEFYHTSFTQQPAPLVVVSLGSGPVSECLQTYLNKAQLTHSIWDNVIIKNRLLAIKFHVRYEDSVRAIVEKIVAHKSTLADTHSPLSPFNAQSDLFPSGVISSRWFSKYTQDVPFAVVCTRVLGEGRENDAVLAEEFASARRKFLGFNTRFIAIVISSGPQDNDRLAQLRQLSGLANLSGFFHLQTLQGDALESDCETLMSSLLNTLKTSATDFYSSIELRVKQRYKKYYTMPRSDIKTSIELSPKILETRNLIKQGVLLQLMHPHNVESSISILEHSYENLLELMSKNIPYFFSKSRTPHDHNVYKQWRTLLDVVMLHIVRCYLSIEEPLKALEKHKAHIHNVSQILGAQPGMQIWIAVQQHWLAELLALVPVSILKSLRHNNKIRGKKMAGSLEYFGGIITAEQGVIITSPEFLCKDAAKHLHEGELSAFPIDIFDDRFESGKDVLIYKIKLLEQAQVHRSAPDTLSFPSFDVQLLYETAETYVRLGNYAKAIESYQLAQQKCELPAWKDIYRFLSEKIVHTASEANDLRTILKQLANLSVIGSTPNNRKIQKLDLSDCSSFCLDSLLSFVSLGIALFNDNQNGEVRVLDTIVCQIEIKSKFDALALEDMASGCNAGIFLNYIDVQYGNEQRIRLNDKGSQASQLQNALIQNDQANFDFSLFGTDPLILQFKHEATKPGWFLISLLKVNLEVHIEIDGKPLVLTKEEDIVINHRKLQHTYDFFYIGNEGVMTRKKKDLKGRNACKLLVKPYRPNVAFEIGSNTQSILIGEKFQTPITLMFKGTKPSSAGCKSINLSVESIIYDDMVETKGLHAHVNWDSLKDDDPLDLLQETQTDTKEHKHNLHVNITRLPSSVVSPDHNKKIVLYFKLNVCDNLEESSEFEVAQLALNILMSPFSPHFIILPRPQEGNLSSIPNPFILEQGSERGSMPQLSRSWVMRLRLEDTHGLLKQQKLRVTEAKLQMRSTNAEVSSNWTGDQISTDMEYNRNFMTSGIHRPTTANVTIVASASFRYKKDGSISESIYETGEEEITLPLQDPRVLLQASRTDNKILLSFNIENPTSRILTFTSTLTTDRAFNKGISWDFHDIRNESPIEQAIFPVLPFGLHTLEYYGTCSTDDPDVRQIELPHLVVFDMHYKVSLPTLSLQDNVKVTETGVIIEV